MGVLRRAVTLPVGKYADGKLALIRMGIQLGCARVINAMW
jgi:hypothetical protein